MEAKLEGCWASDLAIWSKSKMEGGTPRPPGDFSCPSSLPTDQSGSSQESKAHSQGPVSHHGDLVTELENKLEAVR